MFIFCLESWDEWNWKMLTLNRSYLVTSVHQINVRQEKTGPGHWTLTNVQRRWKRLRSFSGILYIFAFLNSTIATQAIFFLGRRKRTCLNYILDLNTFMFRHKTQNRENQKSTINTCSAVAECVPYAVPEGEENNHSAKMHKFSADRLPQLLMNTLPFLLFLICVFVLRLRIVGLLCQCLHIPTQGRRCLQGNLWYSPPAIMTSRLASVTFKMATKVFMEETDKNF